MACGIEMLARYKVAWHKSCGAVMSSILRAAGVWNDAFARAASTGAQLTRISTGKSSWPCILPLPQHPNFITIACHTSGPMCMMPGVLSRHHKLSTPCQQPCNSQTLCCFLSFKTTTPILPTYCSDVPCCRNSPQSSLIVNKLKDC